VRIIDQGISLNRYSVIPRTLIFIFDQAGKVLLLKGQKHKRIWSEKWNGLGGHIEQGEDVYSSARRELLEESGLNSVDLNLCGIVSINTQKSPGILLFIFKSIFYNEPIRDSSEGKLSWFSLDELAHIPCVEDLEILIPRVLSINKGDPIFYAISEPNQSGELKIRFN
jgi:8-oxo-dGTP diphosphatase